MAISMAKSAASEAAETAARDEAFVARGRIRLFEALERGDLEVSSELQEIMSACLMCQRCSEVCPSGVSFMDVLMAAREHLAQEMGLPFGAAFVFRGGGWGHGVGMCQTGSIGMAQARHRVQTILWDHLLSFLRFRLRLLRRCQCHHHHRRDTLYKER